MNTILAALRSIVLGAAVLVSGVSVTRSSLLGFDVAGKVGLDDVEALQAIEALVVDAGWIAPVSVRIVPKMITLPVVKAASARRAEPLRAVVQDAIEHLRGTGTMAIKDDPMAGGYPRVVVTCSAKLGVTVGEHQAMVEKVKTALRRVGLVVATEGRKVIVVPA